MNDVYVSAPGKAFLIGEYGVLEGGQALVAAVDVRAHARAAAPDLEDHRSPVLDAALAAAHESLRARGLPSPATDIGEVHSPSIDTAAFSHGHRKLGLGSSAAVTVAAIGWVFARAGLDLSSAETRTMIVEAAMAAHHRAQGSGSGGDVIAAVHGGVVHVQAGQGRPVGWPTWLHALLVDVGSPASTMSLVARVHEGKHVDPTAHAAAITRIHAAADAFATAFASDDAAAFGALTDAVHEHVEGLRALDRISGAGIVTPAIEAILDDARSHGLAAKPSGAGGGDLVLVFATDPAALDRLAVQLWRTRACGAVATLPPLGDGLRAEPRPALVSRLQGFFRLGVDARRKAIVESAGLEPSAFAALEGGGLTLASAEHMVENVIGTFALPFGVATNFRVNGVDVLVPMVVEEASVIAAASNAAKMIREGGGFWVHADPPWMIAQIQLERRGAPVSPEVAAARIAAAEGELLALADSAHPRLVTRGGGARGLEIRPLSDDTLVVHVLVDCRDAMGANLLNTVAEAAAGPLERLTGWQACLRILSNLTDRRVSHAVARIPPAALGGGEFRGEQVVDLIVDASRFAELDPYRAATHNKGIMNGVDAVVLATGNDWRAMEAGAHAYAARSGRYGPLATWRKGDDGWLEGRIALPTALGTVGGSTQAHPGARLAMGILRYPSAARLGAVVASVGLASNLAALRALATEGIQRGHMTLHARAVALAAGAEPHEIETLAAALVRVGEIKPERASALLASLRAGGA